MQTKFKFVFVFLFIIAHSALASEVVKSANLNNETCEVSYELTRPALVRISLGIEDGPIFATLADWQLRKKGSHKEKWDKTGINEIDSLLCRKDTAFSFNYISSGPDQSERGLKNLLEDESFNKNIGIGSGNINLNRIHKNHKRKFCREPKANIILPEGIRKTKEGAAIIDKPVFLTIEIDSKDKIWFNRERYSLYIFIDNIFAYGLWQGFSPCHWRFDPKGLNQGMHLITVNLQGFSDHLGIALLPVYVTTQAYD